MFSVIATAAAALRVTSPPSLPLPPDSHSPWVLSMRRLAVSTNPVHGGGHFFSDSLSAPSCLVQVVPQPGGAVRMQLGAWGDAAAAVRVCVEALGDTDTGTANANALTIAALDHDLVSQIQEALGALGWKLAWGPRGNGLYVKPATDLGGGGAAAPRPPVTLPDGYTLRPLRSEDAELVDSRWAFRSATSLELVRSMVAERLGCVGVEDARGALCGWILRYAKGDSGMFHVEEAHRRQGLASALLQRAAAELEAAGEPAFAHVVEGNAASERCFEKNGWVRVGTADWLGFERSSDGAPAAAHA